MERIFSPVFSIGWLVDGLALLEEPLVAVVAVVDELLGEARRPGCGARISFMASRRLLVDDLGAGVVLAVLGGVGDGVVHEVDAALVHEVDDHLHLVVALEVGELLAGSRPRSGSRSRP